MSDEETDEAELRKAWERRLELKRRASITVINSHTGRKIDDKDRKRNGGHDRVYDDFTSISDEMAGNVFSNW